SQVSGLTDVNKNIASLTASLRGNQVLDGAALIGRTVVAPGSGVYLSAVNGAEARGAQGVIDVPAGASAVQLVVKDGSGALVKTVALDNRRGPQAFTWDGSTDSGAAAPAG